MTKRMTDERWTVIQKYREFVGVTLHNEMIAARKADLKCIEAIKNCRRFKDHTYLGINPDLKGEFFLVDDVLKVIGESE